MINELPDPNPPPCVNGVVCTYFIITFIITRIFYKENKILIGTIVDEQKCKTQPHSQITYKLHKVLIASIRKKGYMESLRPKKKT